MTSLKIGDTVTIRRGRLKGKPGTVETISNSQVVVKLEDGSLELHNETNLKAPDEATIGASALAKAFTDVASNCAVSGGRELGALVSLADRLAADIPGFSADSIEWPPGVDVNA